jgi:hypothetical protein
MEDGCRGTAEGVNSHIPETISRAPTERFGKPLTGSIPTIIRSYKSAVAMRVNRMLRTCTGAVWQRNYYEHIIRDKADYLAIADYIRNNPLIGIRIMKIAAPGSVTAGVWRGMEVRSFLCGIKKNRLTAVYLCPHGDSDSIPGRGLQF